MRDEATYICDNCGEEIVVPVDPSAGSSQEYVEDCPVCCNPNVIHVEIDGDEDTRTGPLARALNWRTCLQNVVACSTFVMRHFWRAQ